MKSILALILIFAAMTPARLHATRLKDMATVEGVRENQLVGYGLVVGLAGTGDRRQTIFSAQSLTNLLQRLGVAVSPDAIRVTNTAAVLVTASLPPFARPGSKMDVMVSAIGDASNLQGGTLILSPLRAGDGQTYATAQGSVVTGGFSAGGGGTTKTVNHPTAGRIPGGALIERASPSALPGDTVRWVLSRADFTTAGRVADQINKAFAAGGEPIAVAEGAGSVQVQVPAAYRGRSSRFIGDVETIAIETDVPARVVVNERTGTIVIGGEVTILPVSILHGALSVAIQTTFDVSQPGPFSQGKTEIVPQIKVDAAEEKAKSLILPKGATVEQLVRGLTSIGSTPRDVIAILQNLKASGSLAAELEVI